MSLANKDGRASVDDFAIGHSFTGNTTGFSAGVGTASKSDSTWKGNAGNTGYTVGDVITVLKKIGVLAQ